MGKHIHHIVPKHMGGDNTAENLIELTVAEHAIAHKALYEKYGKWQDYIAWKALDGQIDTDDIRREKTRLTWLGRKHTPETLSKIKEARSKQIMKKGWKWSDDARAKQSASMMGSSQSKEANEKRSKKMSGILKPTLECPHCKKIGGAPQMKQWHFDNCKDKIC